MKMCITICFYLLLTATLSWDGFWIGLNDRQIDNRFQWTDGSTVTYTNWNTNEPNNYFNRNEDCVEIRLSVSKAFHYGLDPSFI